MLFSFFTWTLSLNEYIMQFSMFHTFNNSHLCREWLESQEWQDLKAQRWLIHNLYTTASKSSEVIIK